jgi:hypothetical protein
MMKKILRVIYSLIIILFVSITAFAQNCGQVTNFTHTVFSNGNGTSNYTFYLTLAPVTGGTKSVNASINCGAYTFVRNQCIKAPSGGITVTLGPFNNVTNCSAAPSLTWTGYTNDKCGGSSYAGSIIALPFELM